MNFGTVSSRPVRLLMFSTANPKYLNTASEDRAATTAITR